MTKIYIIEKREEGSQKWDYVSETNDEKVAKARAKELSKVYSYDNYRYRNAGWV